MQISPGTTRFFPSIYLPHLLCTIPCSYWASACLAVLPSCATLYVISVRQARGLPAVSLFPHPASFRFHLTMDTLTFGYILPATGRIRVFHPLETCAAGRTKRNPGAAKASGFCSSGRDSRPFFIGFSKPAFMPGRRFSRRATGRRPSAPARTSSGPGPSRPGRPPGR